MRLLTALALMLFIATAAYSQSGATDLIIPRNIFFQFDADELTENSYHNLDALYDTISQQGASTILITVTCNSGADAKALSEKRALILKQMLARKFAKTGSTVQVIAAGLGTGKEEIPPNIQQYIEREPCPYHTAQLNNSICIVLFN